MAVRPGCTGPTLAADRVPARLPKVPPVNTTVENINPARVKISAEVAAEDVERKLDRAARQLGSEIRMPGFRKGKVPAQLVMQRFGREAVFEQAMRESLPEWYERAILDSGVSPVGEPELDLSEVPGEGEPLSFTIEISVRPRAKLGEYKGIEVPRYEPELPEGAVESELERMRSSHASLQPVERAAREGDHLLVDFAGEVDGDEFEGGKASDYLLELGSDSLIEGFEEGLLGASAGEQRTVEVTFPEDYHAEHLAGKPARFHVSVKEVRERRLPELDDDFAADNSDFDTLGELRADIEQRVSHAIEHQIEDAYRDAVLRTVTEGAEIELPDALIEARAIEVWERIERRLQAQGMEPATYLQMQGKEREEAIADVRGDAEQGLRREAVLEAVAEVEDIEVGEEELLEALQPPAGEKGKPEKLLKRLRKEGRDVLLVEEIKLRKATDLLIEHAVPVPTPMPEPEEPQDREEGAAGGSAPDGEGELWTPEGEGGGSGGELWTPGDESRSG
jgi:trigger factor